MEKFRSQKRFKIETTSGVGKMVILKILYPRLFYMKNYPTKLSRRVFFKIAHGFKLFWKTRQRLNHLNEIYIYLQFWKFILTNPNMKPTYQENVRHDRLLEARRIAHCEGYECRWIQRTVLIGNQNRELTWLPASALVIWLMWWHNPHDVVDVTEEVQTQGCGWSQVSNKAGYCWPNIN